MVAGQTEREIVLQLFFGCEAGLEDIFPTGKDAQEAMGRAAELDQTAMFGGGQPGFQERGRVADLRQERLGADPLSPGFARRFEERG